MPRTRTLPSYQRPARDHVEIERKAVLGVLPETLTRTMTASGAFDSEAMVITAVVATNTPVMRRDARGIFNEVLDPAGADLTAEDAPLLDSHNNRTARATLGRAFNFRREGEAILADLRFSTAPDVEPIVHRVRDGTLTSFSIGYRVNRWLESTAAGRVRTAAEWAITEVSLVSQPADPKAKKRSNSMEDEIIEMPEEQANAIRSLGGLMDFPPSWAEDQIEANASLADARASAREKVRKPTPTIRTVQSHDDPAAIVRRQTDALAFRMAGGELPEDARPFVGMSFRDMATGSLERAGVSTRGLSTDDILTRAAQHTTSDFPLVVSNAMNKIALDSYKAAESPIKTLCRQRTLPNFKESTSIRAGELGRLEEMTESGEFTHTTRAESGETMRLKTFGRGLNVSRKLLLDDDANVLGDMTAAFGEAAAQTEADLLVSLLLDNPAMRDGDPVFDAGRGNIGTAGAVTVEALAEARQAMRMRTGLDGKTLISATPRYLLVGADRETEAEKVLASIQPAESDNVNPFAGKLVLLVEPRIQDGSWYLFADPARLMAMQYAYLSAAPGVQIQRAEAWDTLGIKFRAWLDFGAGWVDWRGAHFNEGD